MRTKTSTATQPLLSLCWVVVLSAVSAAALAGKLYKIVDENGNVTFSQFPPQEKSDAAKVEDIAVKTSGSEKLAVRSVGDQQYCGDIRLGDYRPAYRSEVREAASLERRIDDWRRRLENHEQQLQRINERQFDRSTGDRARHEDSTQKNRRYKQYQQSRDKTLAQIKQYRCALHWAEDQRRGLKPDDELAAINQEVERLKAVYRQLQDKLQSNCGREPVFDPSTEYGKEQTRQWESCAKTYKRDMSKVQSRIRNTSTKTRH